MRAAFTYWLLSQVAWVTDAELRNMRDAYSLQCAEVAAAWGLPTSSVTVAGGIRDIPIDDPNAVAVVYSPSIDQPGDLAYHTLLAGRPYCLVLADQSQVQRKDVRIGGSHELAETDVDPLCNLWIPTRTGQIAKEIADPVEGNVVLFDTGASDGPIETSNWVRPEWFEIGLYASSGAKLDRAGLCTMSQSVLLEGYAVVVDGNGNTHQIGEGPAPYKRHPAFRHGRRLAAAHTLGMQIRAMQSTVMT